MSKRQIAQEYLCDFTTSGETFLDNESFNHILMSLYEPILKNTN